MGRRARYFIAALSVTWIGTPGQTAIAEEVPGRLTVHLVNHAHLSASDLRAAEREASNIYASAGIELVWVLGHPAGSGASNTVRVVLLDAQMTRNKARDEHLPDGALGEGSHGGWAYVFTSRVLVRSVSAQAGFAGVLGRVIAHEIGHVLLPEHSHALHGIMQASLELLSGNDRHFTEAQAAVLRNLVTAGN
jgi:hypothetical protein